MPLVDPLSVDQFLNKLKPTINKRWERCGCQILSCRPLEGELSIQIDPLIIVNFWSKISCKCWTLSLWFEVVKSDRYNSFFSSTYNFVYKCRGVGRLCAKQNIGGGGTIVHIQWLAPPPMLCLLRSVRRLCIMDTWGERLTAATLTRAPVFFIIVTVNISCLSSFLCEWKLITPGIY